MNIAKVVRERIIFQNILLTFCDFARLVLMQFKRIMDM